MDDDSKDSELCFYDVLKQPVYVGDVCLSIFRAMKANTNNLTLEPMLVTLIAVQGRSSNFSHVITYNINDSMADFQFLLLKTDQMISDQFIKIQNPEFFVDSEQMAKILVKQSDLKSSLKR